MSLTEILRLVIPAVLSACVIPFLVKMINRYTDHLDDRKKREQYQQHIKDANDAIDTAVKWTMQTFVSGRKSSGAWNDEAGAKALGLAKTKAMELMGPDAKTAITSSVGNFDTWLDAKLEAFTFTLKTMSPTTVPCTQSATPAYVVTTVPLSTTQAAPTSVPVQTSEVTPAMPETHTAPPTTPASGTKAAADALVAVCAHTK